MFLSNPFKGAFGLAIDDTSITLLRLRRHHPWFKQSFFTIDTIRTTPLPQGSIVNGEIEQPEVVRKKIMHLLGGDKTYKPMGSSWVVANLPEAKTFIKLITVPVAAEEISADDVLYQAGKHLPFSLDDAYTDWQIVSSDTRSSDVLFQAVAKTTSDAYTYLLEAAGLNPLALESEAQAIARIMIANTKDVADEACALLHINRSRSCLIVYDKGTIQCTGTISFCLERMANALSNELKVTREEAEKLFITEGARHDKKNARYTRIIDEQIEQLSMEIKHVLTYYKDHFTSTNPIVRITMSGSSAGVPNLDSILSQKLKISTHPGDPLHNLYNHPANDEEQKRILPHTIALGLALRAAYNPIENT